MPFDPEILEDHIDRQIHCGTCGYNLYTLPVVGRCPECGSRYNARGRRMEGIFLPQENVFPSSDLATAGLCACIAAWFVTTLAYQHPLNWGTAVYALLFVIATAMAVSVAWRSLSRFLRFRKIDRDDEE